MSHTPGPWHVGTNGRTPWRIYHAAADRNLYLADVTCKAGDEAGTADDARLIAAAPRLLGACRDALTALEGGDAGTARAILSEAVRGLR